MNYQIRNLLVLILMKFSFATGIIAQDNRDLQYFRTPGFNGLNYFETPKDTNLMFSGIKVRIGGDFTMQFQAIDHSTESSDTLVNLGNNFNLPTANLNLDVQLAEGVRMSLIVYLSSRHHNDSWVKGGHIQVDRLNFIKEDFLKPIMNVLTIKVGLDEINYGDAHFRRSDNAKTIYNPFVGNYIMDAFSTEAFSELIYQKSGFVIVGGISNGKLNQSVIKEFNQYEPSVYGKIGYDRQFRDDFRARLTGSFYISPGYDNGQYLYSGDRTGAHYYHVMQINNTPDNFRSGRFSPDFWKYNSFQVNPFVKWKGMEFFGLLELVQGDKSRTETGGNYTQIGTELIYRIGKEEKFYVGGRYNMVTGKDTSNAEVGTINRINAGGGWFLTNQILVKGEYVYQEYSGNAWSGSVFQGGKFNGFVIEAVLGF